MPSIRERALGEAVKESRLLGSGPLDVLAQRSLDLTRGRFSAFCEVLAMVVGRDQVVIERQLRREADEIVKTLEDEEGGERV